MSLRPPADLFVRADEPPMTPAALESEEVYERERDAKIEWGRAVAGQLDAVCRWMLAAGVEGVRCREAGR